MATPGITPGQMTYPAQIEKGLGRYAQSALQMQPDFSGINNMFSSLAGGGPFGYSHPQLEIGQRISEYLFRQLQLISARQAADI